MPAGNDTDTAPAGRIEVLCGCMFAGKTTLLIERLTAEQRTGRRVLACKHAVDRRYADTALATHDGRTLSCRPVDDARHLEALADGVEVLGVDEAHFFGWPLVEAALRLRERGVHVILVGLDYDMWGRPFPYMARAKAIADVVRIVHTGCQVCGEPARYSQRITPYTGDIVGGPEAYQARCARCFQPLEAPAPDYGPAPQGDEPVRSGGPSA